MPQRNYRIFSQKANTVITNDSFSNGSQEFSLLLTGNRAINFSESYFSYRVKFTKGDGTSVIPADNVTLNMNCISNLYDGCTVYFNGERIESISKYIPQLSAFRTRSRHSRALLNGVLNSRELWSPRSKAFAGQIDAIPPTVTDVSSAFLSDRDARTRKVQEHELCWRPPMSIFDSSAPINNVNIRIALDAKDSAAVFKNALESTGADKTEGTSGATWAFVVTKVRFHAAVYEYAGAGAPYSFQLMPADIQSERLRGSDEETNTFNVNQNPLSISIAFQDPRAGSNTQVSRSKFKLYSTPTGATPTLNTIDLENGPGVESNLTLLSVSHAGIERPNENDSLKFDGTKHFLERYYTASSIMERGYYSDQETFQEWQQRGMYFSWMWPKKGGEKDRRIDVRTAFSTFTPGAGDPIHVEGPNTPTPRVFVYTTFLRGVNVAPQPSGFGSLVVVSDYD